MNLFSRLLNRKPKNNIEELKLKVVKEALMSNGFGYGNSNASKKKKSLAGWITKNGTVDQDITENLPTLRERSLDLYMSGGIAAGTIKKFKTNVIGAGLQLNAQIDYQYLNISKEKATELEAQIEREFKLWSTNAHMCDTASTLDFYDLQGLAFMSMLLSGDCFALLPSIHRADHVYDLKVQIIDASRVVDPTKATSKVDCLAGVELDKYAAPIAYHIRNRTPGNILVGNSEINSETIRVEAFSGARRNVIHLFESERPEQRRGLPILAPVLEQFKKLDRYSSAELTAAVISALFTVFLTRESASDSSPIGQIIPDEEQVDDSDSGPSIELGEGIIQELDPGQKIEIANSSRPNAQFDAFTSSILKQIGVALEIPYEVMIQHFSSSYSASRAALLQAWIMFVNRREWMVKKFCKPIYEEWMTEAVLNGRLRLPGYFSDPAIKAAYTRADFYGSTMPQIDPGKEVAAATARVEQCFTTREQEAAQLGGGNYNEIVAKRVAEEVQMNEVRKITNLTNLKYGNAKNAN